MYDFEVDELAESVPIASEDAPQAQSPSGDDFISHIGPRQRTVHRTGLTGRPARRARVPQAQRRVCPVKVPSPVTWGGLGRRARTGQVAAARRRGEVVRRGYGWSASCEEGCGFAPPWPGPVGAGEEHVH